jgi:hypothetical protein
MSPHVSWNRRPVPERTSMGLKVTSQRGLAWKGVSSPGHLQTPRLHHLLVQMTFTDLRLTSAQGPGFSDLWPALSVLTIPWWWCDPLVT